MRNYTRLIVAFLCLGALTNGLLVHAQDAELNAEDKKELLANERFTDILRKKPRPGTALDRVYEFHISRGTLDSFCDQLQAEISDPNQTQADEKNVGQTALLLGLVQSRRGNDAAARLAFEKSESLLSGEPLASFYLGKALLLIGDTDAAIAAFQRAIERKPEKADSLAIFQELGRVYQRVRRSEDAVNVWKQMEAMFPGDLQVQEQIANVLEEEGARAEALTRFTALAAATKDRYRKVELGVRAASLKMKLNQTAEAVKDFEALLGQVNPGSWLYQDIRQRIDDSYLSRQDTPGLVAYYQRWMEQHPDDVDAMMRIGRLLSIARNSDGAKEWFARAIERSPSAVEPRMALIEALERDGNYSTAATAMQALAELKPDNPDYLVRWGELLLSDYSKPEATRAAAAADVWRKLLAKKPDDPVVVSRVADLMRSANQSDEAVQLYTRAVELADTEPQYREYLGEYLHRLGRSQAALTVWQELASGSRRNRDNLVRLSEVLGTFGFKSQALEAMEQACQMQPTFGHRLRYAEKLVEATRFGDALAQLDLADKLVTDEEEQNLLLEQQIKVHLESGQMAKRIEELELELENGDAAKSASAWKRLALFQEADGKTQAALNSIQQALELSPPSASLINIAARIQEKAGMMGDAVASLRKLISLDRRGQSRVLMQIASMQVRLGQLDKAIQTAQEMLASSDASTEQYRYYADLCFQAGKVDQGLDALRRLLRTNPNNREAIDLLARALSNHFKTDEAIEMTWRSFAKANTTSERVQSVQSLTELYLRTNTFDDLIKRLEVYGREENRAREAVQLTAAAHQASGDLNAARKLLEPLATADSRDSELLTTLVELARADGDWEAAAGFQTRLNKLSPTPEGNLQLARFLLENGDVEQAETIWSKYASQKLTAEDLQNTLRQLFTTGELDKTLGMIDRALKNSPDDWEVLATCMQMLYRCEKEDRAREIAAKLLKLTLPLDTLSEYAKRQRSRLAANTQNPASSPTRSALTFATTTSPSTTSTDRVSVLTRAIQQVQMLIMERENGIAMQQSNAGWSPTICFGEARLVATYLQSSSNNQDVHSKLANLGTESNKDTLWDLAFLSCVQGPSGSDSSAILSGRLVRARVALGMSVITSAGGVNGMVISGNNSLSRVYMRLAELDDHDAQLALCSVYLREHEARHSLQADYREMGMAQEEDQQFEANALKQHLALLKKVQVLPNSGQDDRVLMLSIYLARVLKVAKRDEESQELLQFVKQHSRNNPKLTYANALVSWDTDSAIEMFLAVIKQMPAAGASGSTSNPMTMYTNQSLEISRFFEELLDRQKAVAGLETQSAAANVNRSNPLRLIAELKKLQAERARRMRPSQLSAYAPSNPVRFLARRNIAPVASGMVSQGITFSVATIPFPAASALQSSELLTAMYIVHQFPNSRYREELEKQLQADAEQADQDSMQSAVDHLCWSIWLWWSERRDESLKELEALREVTAVNDLVCMLASRMYFELGRLKDALGQLQSLKPTTAQLMQERELAILQLASQVGDSALAKQSAERLFAMRLPANTQMQVANIMQQLGMNELGSSMLQRLQHRGGNQLGTLQQLMMQYQREDKPQAAREIARQILRRTRSSRTSSNAALNTPRSTNDAYRRQALQILADAPETQKQITELEEKLKNNPKAPSVINQLAELYEATGKTSEANKLFERLRPNSTRNTAATLANRLSTLRQVRSPDSVKTYLELFEKTPALIDQEYPYFQMIVQQTNSWDTVANTIAGWPIERLSGQRWNNLIGSIFESGKATAVDKLLKKLLEAEDFLPRFETTFAMRGKRINYLSDETRQAVVARLTKTLSDPNYRPNSNIVMTYNAYERGFLSSLNNLAYEVPPAKAILAAIAPLAEERSHLKCLQLLMYINVNDSQGIEKTYQDVLALPMTENEPFLRQLASELAFRSKTELAIPLLEKIVAARPIEYSEQNSKGLLLICYEQGRQFDKAKPLLDEAFAVLEKYQSDQRGSLGSAQMASQIASRLAERYMTAGYNLDALAVLYWIKSKPDMQNVIRQLYGRASNPMSDSLTKLEADARASLDAKTVAALVRYELSPQVDLSPELKRVPLPDAMFVPDISGLSGANGNMSTQMRELLGRLNENLDLKAEFKSQLIRLSQNNWTDVPTRGLICAAFLADYLEQKDALISVARVLNTRLAVDDSQNSSEPNDKQISQVGQLKALRPVCWWLAEKLVGLSESELALELSKRAQPTDIKPTMEVLQMRMRLAQSLKATNQKAAAQVQLQLLLDDLYPIETNAPSNAPSK